ncbi:hypothetical protein RN001_013225 [Aquatica leii]|uniref:J domain-containing protein n=1 Tax=Aquatica leii TaxID=1421715 RepID=A0AAN7NW58_9COLE|nr:hypothetical protein RN001_013225 [Aquatica leii]
MKSSDYKKYYNVLNIPEDSDQEDIRKAYLAMVKRYHPDSSGNEADTHKFQEIDTAFRKLMERMARKRWNEDYADDEEDEELTHVTPQHRHYLNNDGVGYGNPFQRQKQYAQNRAMQASDNVMKHRIEKTIKEDKALVLKNKKSHKIKAKYGFERLVEDSIQEAISNGKFDNLSGTGKPLPETKTKNPYVDFVTHKLNQILIDNGFKPEWINLQKEIKGDVETIRKTLIIQRTNFSPCPLNEKEYDAWRSLVEKYKDLTAQVNKKILKYNLLVPILERQMVLVNLEKEARQILLDGKTNKDVTEYLKKQKDGNQENTPRGIVTFLKTFFV